jgi:hypothetical protein
MATTCPKCGAGLAAGAQFCSVCGQSTAPVSPKPAAPPVAAGAKRMPVAALVVLLGGLVVLLGAFWLYQSGNLPGLGGSAAPVAAPPGVPADAGATPPVSAEGTPPPAAATVAATPAGAPAAVAPPPAVEAARPVAAVTAAAPRAVTPPAAPAVPVAAPAPPPPPPPPPFRKTYECREYATFKVDPDTAVVTVDGEVIGIAEEWADTPRTKKYKFKSEGVHYVKLQHKDYEALWLRFIVSKNALDKTAIVELKLKEAKDE